MDAVAWLMIALFIVAISLLFMNNIWGAMVCGLLLSEYVILKGPITSKIFK